MKKRINNIIFSVLVVSISMLALLSSEVFAKESQQELKKQLLITNVKIFDGISDHLSKTSSVLIEDNKIAKISEKAINPSKNTTVIDGKGMVMTPGFIDIHAHVMLQESFATFLQRDSFYIAYIATREAEKYLMHGFTTIRDLAGNTFSLKKAIDQGVITGPRIFPSGAMISQTSGHSDHRFDSDKPLKLGGNPAVDELQGHTAVVDGEGEVLKAVREQLRRGASQIKICVGGGTGSEADPLDVLQFTQKEIRASVEAASDWGTYVTAHVYNSDGVRRAIDNGVKVIEHGQLMDEETMRYMKKKGTWLSPQVIVYTFHPNGYTEDQKAKHDQAYAGIDRMFKTAKKIGFKKIGFGSDIISDPNMLSRINEEFVHRAKWFTPAEILRQATGNNGQILAMSGLRSPYKGKLGVIQEGALADLLLINGNPLEDISILTSHEENIALIMKDGVIYKNIVK